MIYDINWISNFEIRITNAAIYDVWEDLVKAFEVSAIPGSNGTLRIEFGTVTIVYRPTPLSNGPAIEFQLGGSAKYKIRF